MMGVYIKGIEMPKNCLECSLSDVDDDYGRCCLFSGIVCLNIGRQDNCPLVEIKEPHGRLCDLDELKSKFRHSDGDNDADSAWISMIRRVITQAKTIIEAEGK